MWEITSKSSKLHGEGREITSKSVKSHGGGREITSKSTKSHGEGREITSKSHQIRDSGCKFLISADGCLQWCRCGRCDEWSRDHC